MKFACIAMLYAATVFSAVAAQPNFIVIYGEGSGWANSSVQMDDRNPASKTSTIHTPNLERLAASGMRFLGWLRAIAALHAVAGGVAHGSQSGTIAHDVRWRWPARLGRKASFSTPEQSCSRRRRNWNCPPQPARLAEYLKRAGYGDGTFWQMASRRASPSQHGFDENDGATGNGGPDNVAAPNPKQALAMTVKGIDFMERQAKAGKPFYLQLSHYPNQPEKGGGERPSKNAAAETAIVEQTLGQVLDAVARLGLGTNTYIIYTTDHGTPGRNPPLTGGKGTVWEGGLRVPFIAAGPGVKAGSCSHVRVTQTDLFPTFTELARAREVLPQDVEGGSFASVLKNGGAGEVKRSREEFVVHFPHYDKDAQGPASAIYVGDLKLLHAYETGALKLFNIATDPGERRDLASQMPDKAKELDARLMAYLKAMNAQLPKPNPNYDPNKPAEAKRPGGGKQKAQP